LAKSKKGAKKPAPRSPAPRASAKPSRTVKPAGRPVKQAPAGKASTNGKAGRETAKDAKRAPVAAPAPAEAERTAQAPPKFRREYKRWKDILISLRHRLLQEGSHLEEEGLKALEQEVSVDHMADFGSDSSEQETTLQLIENNSLSMRDVDDALKRIEAKTFGLCEDCEALIPPARLQVLPHARFCIACQEKREGMPA
jgi:DnaK suppressor protein